MAAAAAVTVLLPPRIPTTTNVTRCSALPYLPPRVTSTSTTLFSPSLNHFSGSLFLFFLVRLKTFNLQEYCVFLITCF